ncbi:hypothetical protein [Synechococcus sp. MIT S1220]|uniref:hypothetical protein n=1 Tax=Synechococcus sp. MIT S1220 TaxID=3082549 RepID=UPI0039B04134
MRLADIDSDLCEWSPTQAKHAPRRPDRTDWNPAISASQEPEMVDSWQQPNALKAAGADDWPIPASAPPAALSGHRTDESRQD